MNADPVGRRLRRLRVERGWTRETVAARLGLPVRRIEEHERGTRAIEARELVAYVRLYRVSVATLFRDSWTGGNGEC
jgi:transcriptional regulator with XRE-family HTH domain